MKAPVVTILFIPAVLCACDAIDSGINFPPAADYDVATPTASTSWLFEGSWQGTLTSDQSQTTSTAIALINGWSEFRLIVDDAQFVGAPRRVGTSITGWVTGIRAPGSTWSDESRSSLFSLDGTISEGEGEFIQAAYEGGGESGTFALARAARIKSEIGSVTGTWVQYDDNQNILASFQIEELESWRASIHGNHVSGCTYSGETETWTSVFAYAFGPFEVSGCPLDADVDVNGSYSGTGALLDLADDATEETVLVIALSKELQDQLTFFLHRVPE